MALEGSGPEAQVPQVPNPTPPGSQVGVHPYILKELEEDYPPAVAKAAPPLLEQSQETHTLSDLARPSTPAVSSTAPPQVEAAPAPATGFIPYKFLGMPDIAVSVLSFPANQMYAGRLSGGRNLCCIRGPGIEEEWNRQKDDKLLHDSILLRSGQALSELEERFRNPEHCAGFLAPSQESWHRHITPSEVFDKHGVQACMRADLETGRIPKRDQDEPIQCLPPVASSMRVGNGAQFG